jgi:Zn-dependent M28 family amino/carboxypeptidase
MRLLASVLVASLATAQAPPVAEAPMRAHLAFLADDLLEGRGTGQRGGDLAVRYLETQLAAQGLQPVKSESYRQKVQLIGVRTLKEGISLRIEGGKGALIPLLEADAVLGTGQPKEETLLDAPLVFVGFGIEAPEERWDDFKGVDLKGKVLLMLVNDPPPTEEEPARFGGKAMTYYGRWTYKYEQALRHGAAGVLLVHTDASATYSWSVVRNSWSGERFQLRGRAGNGLQGWITEAFARRIFDSAGKDLDVLRNQAETRAFRPVDLGLRIQGSLRSSVRSLDQYNVAGRVPGKDPALREEAVLYTAHWDHFGRDAAHPDRIYNGAVDNASGCAALLAMAQAAVAMPAPRTQIFLFVCAEEQGLLGSEAYARSPLWPLDRTVADLNLDSMNWVGATKDISLFGAERTTLLELGTVVAKGMGLEVGEPRPDTGGVYFRSDHFSLAKAGVPAFSIGGGRRWVKDPSGSKEKSDSYSKRYHQTTDRFDPSWDFSGMVQQAQFTLNLGYAVAQEQEKPLWKPGARLPNPGLAKGP